MNGSVSDLRGPDRAGDLPPPAVLDGHQMLIVANGDLVLRRDMTAQNFDSGTAVLGVFSRGGGVRIGADAPNDMYLDAFVVAPAISGVFGVDGHNSGPPRGTFHLRGGCVESYYGLFGTFGASGALEHGYVRDFLHDGRGVVPPFYPAASPLVAAVAPSRGGPPALRLSAPHPNPAHESLRVSYALPRAGRVLLVLCDVQGRRVATLVDAVQLAGQHDAAWALGPSLGRQIRPGVYTLLLQSGGERSRVRVVLLE